MRKRLNFKTKLIVTIILTVVLAILSGIVYTIFSNKGRIDVERFFKSFTEGTYWWFLLIVYAIVFTIVLAEHRIQADKDVEKDNYGETSEWLTLRGMRKSKDFNVTKFSKLSKEKDGIVLGAKRTGNDIVVIMTSSPKHTLVIGTTGAGKTTAFINPTIQILMNCATKPSFVVSDPKGELFDTHAKGLAEQGYKVEVIDLAAPYYSSRWNPFNILAERVDKINEIYQTSKNEVEVQILRDEIYENAKDLTDAICPLEKSTDMGWQIGARSLINAIILAFCEDYESGFMSKQQLGFASLYHTVFDCLSAEDDTLQRYLYDSRDELSKVKGLAKQVLETTDRTLSSYLSEVYKHTEWLSDTGILSMTSGSDINLYEMDDMPTALFIKVPDEKKTRHRLVTLLITQMYKSLVEKTRRNKANGETDELTLKRTVYFLLDEFGNLPNFNDLDGMITVGRSRKMFFELVVQSYAQLVNKYGKEVTEIVKGQCNVKVFLGSDDMDTINEISTLCGKKNVASASLTTSHEQNTASSGTSTKEVPLIYPTELKNLNNNDDFGNAIILPYGHYAYRSKFTPSFRCKDIYTLGGGDDTKRTPEYFDEMAHVYDINTRQESVQRIQEDLEELQEQMLAEVNAKKQSKEFNLLKSKIEQLSILIPDIEDIFVLDNASKKEYIMNLIANTSNLDIKFKLIEVKNILEKEIEKER